MREKSYAIPQCGIVDKLPIITNVCNFQKNETGKTTLLMYDVLTLFHEF